MTADGGTAAPIPSKSDSQNGGPQMSGQNRPQQRPKAPRKTPAEKSEEFDAKQRQLKEEAAARREAAKPPGGTPPAR